MTATTTYAESVERIDALLASEGEDSRVNSVCHSIVFKHAYRTPRAIAFLHGLTSSPVQFRELGSLFHARGYNVLIVRMPRHGYTDRLTRDPARLTAADYREYAGGAVDLARGLGDHLTIAGLSVSGVLAAWCAQSRADVDLAVPIAPSFVPWGVPRALAPALGRLFTRLPNTFVWWDIRKRARLGAACTYPWFATHALAEAILLGVAVERASRRSSPASRSIAVVTNGADLSVNNTATRVVRAQWSAQAGSRVRQYHFPAALHLPHDIIGPYQPNARVEYVYPILFDLIDDPRR